VWRGVIPLFATQIDTQRSADMRAQTSGADLAPGAIRGTFPCAAGVPQGAGLDVAAVNLEKYSTT
jgi:hypothetical protein